MRNLVSAHDLSLSDADSLLDEALELKRSLSSSLKKLPTLRGKTVVNLFFENSTRTRISFELAAKRLSADVVNFTASESSTSKGESLRDTAQTLAALGADAIVIRHPASGAATTLANSNWIDAAVVNAGDGSYQHPTQALLDAMTLREGFSQSGATSLSGKSVLIVGDVLHSRVARSNIALLRTLGVEVHLAGPEALLPAEFRSVGAKVHHSFDEALELKPDAVMMLRVQRERMANRFQLSENQYRISWSMNTRRLASLRADCLLLHPGPMNRGLEISSEAADSPHSQVLRQVENGVYVRMAVLRNCLQGESLG